VLETAWGKTNEVFSRCKSDTSRKIIVIGADTVVALDNHIYEKPESQDHAKKMLKAFSGRVHSVLTAVCIKTDSKDIEFVEETFVQFGKLSDELIDAYVATNDPMSTKLI
jgi:septum formation protein